MAKAGPRLGRPRLVQGSAKAAAVAVAVQNIILRVWIVAAPAGHVKSRDILSLATTWPDRSTDNLLVIPKPNSLFNLTNYSSVTCNY